MGDLVRGLAVAAVVVCSGVAGYLLCCRRAARRLDPAPASGPNAFTVAESILRKLPPGAALALSVGDFDREQVEGIDPEVDIQLAYHRSHGRRSEDFELVFLPGGEKLVRVAGEGEESK